MRSPVLLLCLLLPASLARGAEASGEEGEVVVVEGERAEGPDPGATSASVTVLQVDQRQGAATDLGQLIDQAAGTTVVSLGGLGDYSAVSIRGSTLRQVQVYLDGVPLNPDGSDVVNLSELPLQAFQRVEVWRGNAPARFAAAPIGGVVNLVSRGAAAPPLASGATGSHGTGRFVVADGFEGVVGGRPADGLLFVEHFQTRGDFRWFDDGGTLYTLTDDHFRQRENNDKGQLAAQGRLRWGDDRLRLTAMNGFLVRDEGLPGSSVLPARQARLSTLRELGVAQIEGGGSELRGLGRLWLLHRQETLDDRAGELLGGSRRDRDRYDSVGLLGDLVWAPAAWVVPGATLSLRQDHLAARDLLDEQADPARSRWSATASAQADLRPLGELLLLSPVVQLAWRDDHALAAGGEGRAALDLLPRLGLLLRPLPALSLKANVARTVRPPDLSELYGDQGAMVGNAALLPERGLSWDVGARLALPAAGWGQGSLDLAHFWSRTQDLIIPIQNAQRTSIPVNFGLAWTQGLEAAADLDLWGWVDLQSSLTWTLSRNLTPDPSVADNQLPRIPALELSQSTGIHYKERLRLGHTWSYTAGSYWDATNLYRSAPRSLHGAFLRLSPRPRWPSAELSVLNLFNRVVEATPRNPLDPDDPSRIVAPLTDFAGYPLPGRTVLLTVRWEG